MASVNLKAESTDMVLPACFPKGESFDVSTIVRERALLLTVYKHSIAPPKQQLRP